jgi:hypothetical protein
MKKPLLLNRWEGKVSADSGQLQSFGDPEVDAYIRRLEDRIVELEEQLIAGGLAERK